MCKPCSQCCNDGKDHHHVAFIFDASPSQINVIVGSVFGGVFVIAFLISYAMVKPRKTCKEVNDLSLAETAGGERTEQMQENNPQVNVRDGNETDHSHPSAGDPEETTVRVQESGDNSKDKTGIQKTKRLFRHSGRGKTKLQLFSAT